MAGYPQPQQSYYQQAPQPQQPGGYQQQQPRNKFKDKPKTPFTAQSQFFVAISNSQNNAGKKYYGYDSNGFTKWCTDEEHMNMQYKNGKWYYPPGMIPAACEDAKFPREIDAIPEPQPAVVPQFLSNKRPAPTPVVQAQADERQLYMSGVPESQITNLGKIIDTNTENMERLTQNVYDLSEDLKALKSLIMSMTCSLNKTQETLEKNNCINMTRMNQAKRNAERTLESSNMVSNISATYTVAEEEGEDVVEEEEMGDEESQVYP